MQFTFWDILEKNYGTAEADRIFYEAGELAGRAFYEHVLGDLKDFDSFIKGLQSTLEEMKILDFASREIGPGKRPVCNHCIGGFGLFRFARIGL